ncbi:hypothetical protein D3C74_445520 [compost metagenome]
MVYWVKSLVPMDTKSQRCRIWPASTAADGTSIMVPAVARPAARAIFAKSSASAGVEIIGAITQTSASCSLPACAMALSWRSSTPGLDRSVR